MLVISVLEYPEDDQAQNYLVDLEALDLSNPGHKTYYDAIRRAVNDPYGLTKMPYGACCMCGGIPYVQPPVLVHETVTIYIV